MRALASFAALLVVLGCSSQLEEHAAAESPRPPGSLHLDAAERERLGIVHAAATPAGSEGKREAYGRALDPVPLAEQSAARASARAVFAQARIELERIRALHRNDQNASTRELESAELGFRRAELDLATAQGRLTASFGDALAARDDLETLVRRLTEQRAALARIEVPAGDATSGLPSSVRLLPSAARGAALEGSLLGAAPTMDLLTQGRAFLVLIEQQPPKPGTSLTAELRFPENAISGLLVPQSAILWQDGAPCVWVETAPDTFERRGIVLHEGTDDGWIASGLEAGAGIVISGAQELLSQELLGGQASK